MDNVLLVALAIAVIGLGLISAALAGRDRRDHRTTRQLASVERKLDALLEHLGVEVAEQVFPEVMTLLADGKKIAAIKAYRKATGAGLADAKAAVDRLDEARTTSPPANPATAPKPAAAAPAPEAAPVAAAPAPEAASVAEAAPVASAAPEGAAVAAASEVQAKPGE